MGTSSINDPFSMAMLNNQMVSPESPGMESQEILLVSTNLLNYPYAPCTVYLPTFGPFMG